MCNVAHGINESTLISSATGPQYTTPLLPLTTCLSDVFNLLNGLASGRSTRDNKGFPTSSSDGGVWKDLPEVGWWMDPVSSTSQLPQQSIFIYYRVTFSGRCAMSLASTDNDPAQSPSNQPGTAVRLNQSLPMWQFWRGRQLHSTRQHNWVSQALSWAHQIICSHLLNSCTSIGNLTKVCSESSPVRPAQSIGVHSVSAGRSRKAQVWGQPEPRGFQKSRSDYKKGSGMKAFIFGFSKI